MLKSFFYEHPSWYTTCLQIPKKLDVANKLSKNISQRSAVLHKQKDQDQALW